uniref:Odorant receptor n=1 Tax=Sirex noctilio TaxID=36765 RepID=A0A857N3J0_9HYME|nr:odorant receptor 14 [Sirex noctilio]
MKEKSNEDIDYALSANRWSLISSGLWSRLKTTKSFCSMGTFAFFTMNLLNGLTCIPQFVDLYLIWGSSYDMFENMKCSLVLIFMQFKGIAIWTKMKQVGFLLGEIHADWEREALDSDNLLDQELLKRREVMMSFAKIGRIMSYIMTVTTYGAAIFFLPTRYLKAAFFNVTVEERQFPYETEYLTNAVKHSPYYEMIYLSQMIGGTLCVTTNFAVDSTVAVVTVHICGQFKILANDWNKLASSFEQEKIDEWTRKRNVEVTKATLKKLVQRHLHLVGLADVIEETFSAIVLLQLIVSSIVISLIGFYFIQAIENTDVLSFTIGLCYLTSQTLFIFVYCFSGQELYNQILKTTGSYVSLLRAVR